jgi:hypothetical protein
LSNHEAARRPVVEPSAQLRFRQAQDERTLGTDAFSEGAARLSGVVPRLLGWRPAEFWNATPAEVASILGALEPAGAEPLSRSELERLMERDDG